MNKKNLPIIIGVAVVLVLAIVLGVVFLGGNNNDDKNTTTTTKPSGNTEAEYKLGMGVVSNANDSKTGAAQIDATVAAVVTDKDGKIVLCRIDAVQNKITLNDNGTFTITNLKTKMELGDDYNMSKYGQSMDWNGDGIVKEWYEQAKAFENYVVGKTAAEVAAIETAPTGSAGYVIATDKALLDAGCTIQIQDFIDAVVKACKDDQGMTFKTDKAFTLGVAAKSYDYENESTAATSDKNGVLKIYSDFAASVVIDGKIIASLNDAIQPEITFDVAGKIVETTMKQTKRELKENYNMSTYGASIDPNGDGIVKEWYLQSAAFSNHVIGMTGNEVANMETKANSINYQMTTDADLLAAGCTIQITGIKAVVAESVTNAR